MTLREWLCAALCHSAEFESAPTDEQLDAILVKVGPPPVATWQITWTPTGPTEAQIGAKIRAAVETGKVEVIPEFVAPVGPPPPIVSFDRCWACGTTFEVLPTCCSACGINLR